MAASGSGRVSGESLECQTRGIRTRRNHPLDRLRPGQITRKRNPRMNQEIGATDSRVVMRRVGSTCPGMVRADADAAE